MDFVILIAPFWFFKLWDYIISPNMLFDLELWIDKGNSEIRADAQYT